MNIFTFSNLVRFTQQSSAVAASLGLVCLALIGCETAPDDEPALQTATLALASAKPAAGPAETVEEEAAEPVAQVAVNGPGCDEDWTLDNMALVNTEPEVLARFPLQTVLQQLVDEADVNNTTAQGLWSQWWSSQRAREVGDPTQHPFCDDNGSTINGFPIDCPRAEFLLADTTPDSHLPVAVFNRLDMAPLDGAHCGEYRIVYALDSDEVAGRNFVIFEAVMPNPNPECGVAACRPIAELWAQLPTLTDPEERADLLETFYLDGIDGFPPVVLPEHYGMGSASGGGGYGATSDDPTGQIRTNQFLKFPWNLREYTLDRVCQKTVVPTVVDVPEEAQEAQEAKSASDGSFKGSSSKGVRDPMQFFSQKASQKASKKAAPSKASSAKAKAAPVSMLAPALSCELLVRQTTVKGNPDESLWDSNNALFPSDEVSFLGQMENLLPNPDGLNSISMATPESFNAGESIASFGGDATADTDADGIPGNTVPTSIDQQLANLGLDGTYTPEEVGRRATSQSCAGCHFNANGLDLGNGVQFPNSNIAFVHVDEASTLSTLLTMPGGFLDHRLQVLSDYLDVTCENPCSDEGLQVSVDGQLVVASDSEPSTGGAKMGSNGKFGAAASAMPTAKSAAPGVRTEGTLGGSTTH
ncbi:MAG: hypothetical protein VX938_12050 [Myxococcota bacterium]|nr:hypothetical protein [Myxococcota bacterium]